MSQRRDISRWCYACGDLNPIGLHLEFRLEDEWAVATFVAGREHQGYPGFVHGGVVSSLLDEAMGWATYGRGIFAVTARLETRFRGPIPAGLPLQVRARVKRDRGRALELEADLKDETGQTLAEASGLFFRMGPEQAAVMQRAAESEQDAST